MPVDIKKVLIKEKITLYEVERYCNNYFNPTNDPNSKERNYPDAFLELVGQIADFKRYMIPERKYLANTTLDDFSEAYKYNSWQNAYAPELWIYKRIKSL